MPVEQTRDGPWVDGPRQWVVLRENRTAYEAAARIVEGQSFTASAGDNNPLFLHGPAGTGKSKLLGLLVAGLSVRIPGYLVRVVPATELAELLGKEGEAGELE